MLYGSDKNGEIHTHFIYPLVIISDRYGGCYSGGVFTVWDTYPENIPYEIFSDDNTCEHFWRCEAEDCIHHYGVGNTIQDAIDDLYSKLPPGGRMVEIEPGVWETEAFIKEDNKNETRTDNPVII